MTTILNLALNVDFWSALLGFLGSMLIFFFGLPPRVDPEGHIHLILEQTCREEIKKATKYKRASYVGICLLALSFLLQLLKITLAVS